MLKIYIYIYIYIYISFENIYPSELKLKKENISTSETVYFDLSIMIKTLVMYSLFYCFFATFGLESSVKYLLCIYWL